MNIEPFLLASSLQVVAAQRLVRRICEHCKEEFPLSKLQQSRMEELFHAISPEEVKAYKLDPKQRAVFYYGKGCEECGQTGYKGRIAIYEVIAVDEYMRTIITDKNGNDADVRKAAGEQGMLTLKQDGILKALQGITTLSEVERVTEGKVLVDEE